LWRNDRGLNVTNDFNLSSQASEKLARRFFHGKQLRYGFPLLVMIIASPVACTWSINRRHCALNFAAGIVFMTCHL